MWNTFLISNLRSKMKIVPFWPRQLNDMEKSFRRQFIRRCVQQEAIFDASQLLNGKNGAIIHCSMAS